MRARFFRFIYYLCRYEANISRHWNIAGRARNRLSLQGMSLH